MPLNGQKLSQTGEVISADSGHYLPIFKPNVSNQRIKVFELLQQLVTLVNAYTKPQIDDLLNAKADDSAVVHKAGAETITGGKTFGVFPILPSSNPTLDYQAVHKKYVDDLIAIITGIINDINIELQDVAIDSEVVHKNGNETVNDVKTFTEFPMLPTTFPTIDEQAVNKKYVDQEISVLVGQINSIINDLNNYALDANVVHLSGNETIDGIKTFNSSPVVPVADANNEAVNKGQMDAGDDALQSQVDSRWIVPININCSGNPNYPPAVRGQTWLVTASGKIGGASGPSVDVSDIVLCLTSNGGGSQALVGSSFTIIQGKLSGFLVASNFATLRYFVGSGAVPGGYTPKPLGNIIQDSGLIGTRIYGMMFLDNVPVDLFDSGVTHNEFTGELNFTAMGGLFDGQKLLITTIKET